MPLASSPLNTVPLNGASTGAPLSSDVLAVDVSASFGELESVTASQLEGGENHAIAGREIIAFKTADLTAPFKYDLSEMVREVRESPGDGHAVGELFALITDDVVRIGVSEELVGSTVLVKCVSKYQDISDVNAKPVVIAPRTPETIFVPDDVYVPVEPFDLVFDTGTLSSGTNGVLSAWQALDFSGSVPVGAAAVVVRWNMVAVRTGGSTGDNFLAMEYRRSSSWTAQRFAEAQIIMDGAGDSSPLFSGQAILNVGADLAGELRYMEQSAGTYAYKIEVVGYLKKP